MATYVRLFILGLILAITAFIAYLIWQPKQVGLDATDYESCAKLEGAKVLLSDPLRCISPDGFIFIKEK